MTQIQAFAPSGLQAIGAVLLRDPDAGRRAIRAVPGLGKTERLELLRKSLRTLRDGGAR